MVFSYPNISLITYPDTPWSHSQHAKITDFLLYCPFWQAEFLYHFSWTHSKPKHTQENIPSVCRL